MIHEMYFYYVCIIIYWCPIPAGIYNQWRTFD